MDLSKIKNIEVQSMMAQLNRELEEVDVSKIKETMIRMAKCKMHNYSYYNSMLIWMQGGTRCGSIASWKANGRKVVDPEKGLFILRPFFSTHQYTEVVNGKTEYKVRKSLGGFTDCRTYDISNTEPIDGVPVKAKVNRDFAGIDLQQLIKAIKEKHKFTVEQIALKPTIGGYAMDKKIVINAEWDESSQKSTLIHEFAHCRLHQKHQATRDVQECEAELVSYMVRKEFEPDPDEYTILYLRSWRFDQVSGRVRFLKCWQTATEVMQMITGKQKRDSI